MAAEPNIFRGPIPYHYTVEVRNRFKGLDLIDRVPDELWTEVRDIVQETGMETIPKKEKRKKAKRLPEEALQTAVKRRDVKSKGEKQRYTHLNAEFQRIARRDKTASGGDGIPVELFQILKDDAVPPEGQNISKSDISRPSCVSQHLIAVCLEVSPTA